MCVGLRVTVTGEVLDTAYDTSILQALQIVGHHRRSHLRVVAESTGADNDVVRIGVHIGYRGEVDVKAVVLQIGADGVATLVGIVRVSRNHSVPVSEGLTSPVVPRRRYSMHRG